MPSCLGLYIEKNLIKYAKVTKDHDFIKVDSFGIRKKKHWLHLFMIKLMKQLLKLWQKHLAIKFR